ncbi:hypothetical protein L6R52_36995 [Myxococcota bacterium]|nr:hypothetical protein [Myxococcota bacterium]
MSSLEGIGAFVFFLVVAAPIGIIAIAIRERMALARFVRAAADPDRLKDVALKLPLAYRAPATAFAGELARKTPLDEALTQALTRIANTHFGRPVPVRAAAALVISVLALGGFIASLTGAAQAIEAAAVAARDLAGARVFLETKAILDPAFDLVRTYVRGTQVLGISMSVNLALAWWLLRSEVREARFVKALIEASIAARPNATAPVAGRVAALLAPERSLTAPVAAFAFFVAALATSLATLWLTSGFRESNAGQSYAVWPADARAPLVSPSGMVVPSFPGGGSPVRERSLATLAVGPERVDLAGDLLVDLDARFALPASFPQGANDVSRVLSGFKRGGTFELNLLGHASTPMTTILGVLMYLKNEHGLQRVTCVLERAPAGAGARVPAGLKLELGVPEGVAAATTLVVEGSRVVLDPGAADSIAVDRTDPAWRLRLGEAVRVRTGAKQGAGAVPVIGLVLRSTELPYDRFLEILSSADSTCPTTADCGVPGLGARFVLER